LEENGPKTGMWHKLKADSINEEITAHRRIKKGHADTAGEDR
jgi:hypothetical protein